MDSDSFVELRYISVFYGFDHIIVRHKPEYIFRFLYHYPPAVISTIRNILCKNLPVSFEGASGITLYLYDNDTFILRSFLPYNDKITVTVNKNDALLFDLEEKKEFNGVSDGTCTKFQLTVMPGVNYVMKVK